jgi:hypothetical protein
MPSLVTIRRVAAPDRGFDGLGCNAEPFGGGELFTTGTISVRVSQLQSESQYAISKVEKVGRK